MQEGEERVIYSCYNFASLLQLAYAHASVVSERPGTDVLLVKNADALGSFVPAYMPTQQVQAHDDPER